MTCPDCGANRWRVIKTWRGKHEISRRRECLECGHRVTSDERIRNGGSTNGEKMQSVPEKRLKSLTLTHVRRKG